MDYNELLEYIDDNFLGLEYDPDREAYIYHLEDEAGDTIFSIAVPFDNYLQGDTFIDRHIIVKSAGSKWRYITGEDFIRGCKNTHIENYNEILKVKHYVEDGGMQDDVDTLFELGFEGLDGYDQSGD